LSPNNHIALAEGGFTYAGGRSSITPFIEQLRSNEITAVFATNDLMAFGAMEALSESGIEVPNQVSVVGFDDTNLASFIRPRLTTVRQDVMAMGEAAAEWLIASLRKETKPSLLEEKYHKILPVTFVGRESTKAISTRPNLSDPEGWRSE
jgi:DNA-binding LacI/PurR family transcriptional regulator